MKTVEQVNQKLAELRTEGVSLKDYVPAEKKQLSKIKKRIKFLDEARLYLETSPRESFVIEQKNGLVVKLAKMLDDTYQKLTPKSKAKYKKRKWRKANGATIRFIKLYIIKILNYGNSF